MRAIPKGLQHSVVWMLWHITCNELPRQAIFDLSQNIDLKALLAYRLAVGKRIQLMCVGCHRVNESSTPRQNVWNNWKKSVQLEHNRTGRYVTGDKNPNAKLLLMPATRHCFVHFNEATRMLPKLKRLAKEAT